MFVYEGSLTFKSLVSCIYLVRSYGFLVTPDFTEDYIVAHVGRHVMLTKNWLSSLYELKSLTSHQVITSQPKG